MRAKNDFEFVFMSQATSRVVFDLCCEVSRRLGPALLISGNTFEIPDEYPALTLWQAPKYDNSSFGSRSRTWLQYVFYVARRSFRLKGRPVLLVNSNPPLNPWLAYLLKTTRGWPFVARILDIYPDAVARHGLFGERHPALRVWRFLNRRAYAKADAVVTLAPLMAELLGQQVASGTDIEIIPDWVDPDWIKPLPKVDNWFAKEHGQLDKLTVLYSGNLGLTHDISGLYTAIEELQPQRDICFVFIGGGARRGELETLSAKTTNMLLLPFQPEESVPSAMASGDVAVVTLGRGTEGISMPSKAYYMMAAGCALLGVSHGDNDLGRLIDRYQCGISVSCEDSDGIRKAILRFHKDRDFLARCKANSRRAAETDYSATVCIQQYIDLLSRLGQARGAR